MENFIKKIIKKIIINCFCRFNFHIKKRMYCEDTWEIRYCDFCGKYKTNIGWKYNPY